MARVAAIYSITPATDPTEDLPAERRRNVPPALPLPRSEHYRHIGRNPRAPSAIKEEKNSAWLATLASGSLKKTHWPLSVNLSVK